MKCANLPRRWEDDIGPINVVGRPQHGWVILRRPGNSPWLVFWRDLVNGECERGGGAIRLRAAGKDKRDV